jgi:hypothetical protein
MVVAVFAVTKTTGLSKPRLLQFFISGFAGYSSKLSFYRKLAPTKLFSPAHNVWLFGASHRYLSMSRDCRQGDLTLLPFGA